MAEEPAAEIPANGVEAETADVPGEGPHTWLLVAHNYLSSVTGRTCQAADSRMEAETLASCAPTQLRPHQTHCWTSTMSSGQLCSSSWTTSMHGLPCCPLQKSWWVCCAGRCLSAGAICMAGPVAGLTCGAARRLDTLQVLHVTCHGKRMHRSADNKVKASVFCCNTVRPLFTLQLLTASDYTPQDVLTHIQAAYDGFLAAYPLCFGYWKKYAAAEKRHSGDAAAIAVLERGVAAVPYSVDLWLHYALFQQGREASSVDDVRRCVLDSAGSWPCIRSTAAPDNTPAHWDCSALQKGVRCGTGLTYVLTAARMLVMHMP